MARKADPKDFTNRNMKYEYCLAKYRYQTACNQLWKEKAVLKRLNQGQSQQSSNEGMTDEAPNLQQIRDEIENKKQMLASLVKEKNHLKTQKVSLIEGNKELEKEVRDMKCKVLRPRSLPDTSKTSINKSQETPDKRPSLVSTFKMKLNMMVIRKKTQYNIEERKRRNHVVPFPEISTRTNRPCSRRFKQSH